MFDNKDNTEYTDDLIKAGQEPIIIKQKDSSDKKFIYTILILLVILFIIALGVIAYLGSKFFSTNAPVAQQQPTTVATQNVSLKANSEPKKVERVVVKATPSNTTTAQEPKKVVTREVVTKKVEAKKEEPKKVEPKKAEPKVEAKPKVAAVANKTTTEDIDIAELESIVNESETKETAKPKPVKKAEPVKQQANSGVQQAIGVAANATGTKKLTQEEMAKIAKLVALELAKAQAEQKKQASQQASKASSNTNSNANSNANSNVNNEDSLVKSLQEADTDTLQAQEVDLNAKVHTNKVKAGSAKKVDTFNKVVVEQTNNTDDEFAKLSSEIDSILAQDEVKQNKANKEITSKLQSVVKDRQKEMRFIVVKKGDTLSSLAYRAYGRASAYVKIYKANPDLVKNPNRIYVGMRLRVPVDEEYKGNQQ